jgi:hypothetical protein
MSDLDFSHHVSEIPEGDRLAKPYSRSVGAEVIQNPNLQNAVTNYADASNWMSTIGSTIATRASNAIAEQLGSEIGKNPKGSLSIPLTEFDDAMHKSYATQSQATLGLQANKLINDSNLEMAKATRITPDLIEKTNKNISLGLKNIFQNAPAEIRPNLEYQYTNLQMSQMSSLTKRMLKEQTEDRINTSALTNQMNAEHAYSFGLNGNEKAAIDAIQNTQHLNDANVLSRITDPQSAKTNVDTVRKSYLSGKMIHDYENAKGQGKGEEYLKNIADKKPSYLSDTDYMSVTNNLMTYVNHQDALRNEDQQLTLAKFNNDLFDNPKNINLTELKQNLSPIHFQQAQLEYKKALARKNNDDAKINEFIPVFSNPEAFSRASNTIKQKVFDRLVNKTVDDSQKTSSPLTREEAQVQVAASAGGPIHSFVSALNYQAASSNPIEIEKASQQVHALREKEAGRALIGLNKNSDALFTKYEALRSVMPSTEAAKIATDIVYNKSPKQYDENQQAWSNELSKHTRGGILPSTYVLQAVGSSPKNFMSPSMAHVYGSDILENFNTYFNLLNGDTEAALKNVKREFDENYGETYINGKPFTTLHPIEKVLGYHDKDVVPFIQQDMANQLKDKFSAQKSLYHDNKANEYWEVVPSALPQKGDKKTLLSRVFGEEYNPVKVQKVMRIGNQEKKEIYDVVVQGNAYNQYDISVKSSSGILPIFQVAPYLGITTYLPNKEYIDQLYNHYK